MKSNLLNLFSSLSILLLAAVGQSSAQTTQSDTRPHTASIGGQVTISGQAAANVTVKIVENDSRAGGEFFGTSRATAMSEPRTFNLVTDAQGRYRLAGLAAGTYKVSAASKTYVLSNQNSDIEPVKWITLDGGEAREDVDLSLARGGVITGRVTAPDGRPLIATRVWLYAVLRQVDRTEYRSHSDQFHQMFETDDRGVYRLYGLTPGGYLVSIRSDLSLQRISPNDGVAPTYHPSSTCDTAAEIAVKSGGEVAGVDIRYRGDRGHIISGVVTGAGEGSHASVWLYSVATGAHSGYGGVRPYAANSFAIRGVGDGEYEIFASAYGRNNEADSFVSSPGRLTVRGADVGGIELKLAPRAFIAGKIVVENQPDVCETMRKFSIQEALIALRRDEKTSRAVYRRPLSEVAPDDKGEFAIRHIDPGRYFIFFTTPVILLILLSPASAPAQQRDGNSNAATVRGRVTVEGKPAARVVVILSRYDGGWDGPRQFAGETDAKGRFKIAGLAPGSYEIRPHAYVFVLANQSTNAGANRRIVVRAGETIDDVSIKLVRGGVVTGRVVDEDGRPVVGDDVWLVRPPGDSWPRTPLGSESPFGETDDRGVYRLFGVPPGRYLVVISHRLDDGRLGGAGLGDGGFGYHIFYPNTTDLYKAKVIEVSAGEEKTEINITVVPP